MISKGQLKVIKQVSLAGYWEEAFYGKQLKTQRLKNVTLLGTSTLVPVGFIKENIKVCDKITEFRVRERPDHEGSYILCSRR